ncbi:hypothetical protein [Streptomyces sp. NPDC055105]|uniref:hypothetical protein n=1 Tax=Streptomyces sp. NPDC055105 TaxID=3365719 RepID=UPI0037D507A5
MRREGHDFDHIAEVLEYSSRGAATKDLIRCLEQNRDEEAAEASIYRQEENERLLAMLRAVWPQAEEGDPRAIDTVLKISKRRSEVCGYDMPVKSEVSGPDGGVIPLGGTLAELKGLIATAGEQGPVADFDMPAIDGREDTGGDD